MAAQPEKKAGKGGIIAAILFAVLAAGGIGFGVWEMMDKNTQEGQFKSQIDALKKTNSELMDQITELQTQINEPVVEADDYLTIDNFGIKIKKSDDFPDMVIYSSDESSVSFFISESAEVPNNSSIGIIQAPTCDKQELRLGYSGIIEVDGKCYLLGEIGVEERPSAAFLDYIRDNNNYSKI